MLLCLEGDEACKKKEKEKKSEGVRDGKVRVK